MSEKEPTVGPSSQLEQEHDVTSKPKSLRENRHSGSPYVRFFAMVGASTALMFGLMYLNTYSIEHVYWSETRFYMTFVMGATMTLVMLLFMWRMYRNFAANVVILLGSISVFMAALWLVRSQETVQDESWMSAMIPHHSIAVMTSKRAEITDPRVAKLANTIVDAQNREISEMRFLLSDITSNGEAGQEWALGERDEAAPIQSLPQAISTPVLARIRPETLSKEDIERGLGREPECTFVQAIDASPVLATDSNGTGIAKISGALVRFESESSLADGGVVATEGGEIAVVPGAGTLGEDATLLFKLTVDPGLLVGFSGYWTCDG